MHDIAYYILLEPSLISWPRNLFVHLPSLSHDLSLEARSQIATESTTSVTMTQEISSHESSCLARPAGGHYYKCPLLPDFCAIAILMNYIGPSICLSVTGGQRKQFDFKAHDAVSLVTE